MWPAAAAAAAAAASPRPGIDIVMVARVAGLQLQLSSSFISDQSSALIGRCLVSAAHLHLHLHSAHWAAPAHSTGA